MSMVDFDQKARHLLNDKRRKHGGQAIIITSACTYGMADDTLVVEWGSAPLSERNCDLVKGTVVDGVPVYLHTRLAAYARFNPLCVTARPIMLWQSLALVGDDTLLRRIRCWEATHPILGAAPVSVGVAVA